MGPCTGWPLRIAAAIVGIALAGGLAIVWPWATPWRPDTRRADVDPDIDAGHPYSRRPYSTAQMGYFATGMALVDLNGDRWPDMVVSNGNDMAPQSLIVFFNKRDRSNPFDLRPSWYSADIDYHGGLATGDIDGDGNLDVAVTMTYGLRGPDGPDAADAASKSSAAKIYKNLGAELESAASFHALSGRRGIACAFGDIDGDGALDLAVAQPGDPSGSDSSDVGDVHIYMNHRGTMATHSTWFASAPGATDVAFADVDADGAMDLVVAGRSTLVFYGAPSIRPVPLSRTPGFASDAAAGGSYGADYGQLAPGQPISVVSAVMSPDGTPSTLYAYTPPSTTPVWTFSPTDSPLIYASRVLLADLNGDENLDLAVGQWGPQALGGSLSVFFGRITGGPFDRHQPFVSATSSVLQALDVSDTRRLCVEARTYEFNAPGRWSVVTLPERRVGAIRAVSRNGQRLSPDQYAWTPRGNWVSLPIEKNDRIEIEYETSKVLDLAVATFHNYAPPVGNYVFYSSLRCPSP